MTAATMRVLSNGHKFEDGATAVHAVFAGTAWRVLLDWPANHHRWSICRVSWYDDRGWVRHSTEEWAHTRAELEEPAAA